MKHRTPFIIASIFLLGLLGWWFTEHAHHEGAAAMDANVAVRQPPPPISQAEIQRQFAAMEQDKQSVGGELSRREADQASRARAGAKTVEYRKGLQVSRGEEWTKFIRAHLQTYKDLGAVATSSRHGQTPCTICNGRGSMDSCFLCQSSGKCPTCKGTGKLYLNSSELCPTCIGTGKCYQCGGSGKLICPFCDDGTVDFRRPAPPTLLPLH